MQVWKPWAQAEEKISSLRRLSPESYKEHSQVTWQKEWDL